MNLNEIKQNIKEEIEATNGYSDFLKVRTAAITNEIGEQRLQCLHFFNLGYQSALKNILSLLDKKDDDQNN